MFWQYLAFFSLGILPMGILGLPAPILLEFSLPEEHQRPLGGEDMSLESHMQHMDRSSNTQLQILQGDHKHLFQISGYKLLPRTPVDRESVCVDTEVCILSLVVAVLSNFELVQIFNVKVKVLDINDNSPRFASDTFSLDIPSESIVGSMFLLPHATDADAEQNGLQGYQLFEKTSRSGLFTLDISDVSQGFEQPKLVVSNILDRDSTNMYYFDLIAFDGGTPLKSGSVKITVKILESNKHPPQYQQHLYTITCKEDQEIGSELATVRAVDPDWGENGRITYSFEGSGLYSLDGVLKINESTGIVSLHSPLDYETIKEYHFDIMAEDHGNRPLKTQSEIRLEVQDVNDCLPSVTFSPSGLVSVQEHSPEGSFVVFLSISDEDSGNNGKVSCHIEEIDFKLQKLYGDNYQLAVAGPIDYEVKSNHTVTITCTDIGTPPLEHTEVLTVQVIDINDNSPQFELKAYTKSLKENSSTSVIVVSVKASDLDSGDNGKIMYRIEDEKANRYLSINSSTGDIYTRSRRPLDYERFRELTFSVSGTDQGFPPLTDTTTVTLSLIDVNDEPPHFSQQKYVFGSFENQAKDTEIGTVEARDPDTPPFDNFYFYLLNDTFDARSFILDNKTGTLRTTKVLDREKRPTYFFRVGARNTQPPYLISTAEVTVYVVDKNDNAPVIHFPSSVNNTVHILPNYRKNSKLTRINATDADFGKNSVLTYSIVKGNKDNAFRLNDFDGSLYLDKDIPFTEFMSWELDIRVQDTGDPPRSSLAILTLLCTNRSAPPSIGDNSKQNTNSTALSKSTSLPHKVIIIIIASSSAGLIIAITLIVCLIKKRKSLHDKKCKELLEKDETESLHAKGNLYSTLSTATSPIQDDIDLCNEHLLDESDLPLPTVVGLGTKRPRLHGISETPLAERANRIRAQRMAAGNMDEAQSTTSNDSGEPQGLEDIKPMQASTDMQLFKLIKWLKEVQRNEKQMSSSLQNVNDISLPGSGQGTITSDEVDSAFPNNDSDPGMIQRQAFLRTISPSNAFLDRTLPSLKHRQQNLPHVPYSKSMTPDVLTMRKTIKLSDNSCSSEESLEDTAVSVPKLHLKSTFGSSRKPGFLSTFQSPRQDTSLKTPEKGKVICHSEGEIVENKGGEPSFKPNISCDEIEQCKDTTEADNMANKNNNTSKQPSSENLAYKPKNSNLKTGPDNYVVLGTFKPDKDLKKVDRHNYTDINMNDLNQQTKQSVV